MKGRIGIRTAHALDKGGDCIIVGISLFIIRVQCMAHYFFYRFFCQSATFRYEHAGLFQQVQSGTGITIRPVGQEL